MKKPDKATKQRLENVEDRFSAKNYMLRPIPLFDEDFSNMNVEEATDYYMQLVKQPMSKETREALDNPGNKISQEEASRIYHQIMKQGEIQC